MIAVKLINNFLIIYKSALTKNSSVRQKAEVNMEGQFLVRQIYDDEITYNLVGAAVEVLSKSIYKIVYHRLFSLRSKIDFRSISFNCD